MNMESMDPAHRGVKRRRYDASRRRAEAARTHARVLEVAERLLLSNGYAATSVAAVATAAGVSAELIYKAFGGKAGLVREIQRRGLLGGGPVPARERSDAFSATDMDARSLLREWTRLSTEVAPRVAPITLLVRSAAATDADLADLLKQMAAQRLERMALNAERLTAHAGVRRDLTVEQIRDVMWTYTSPDLYDLLVGQRGWTVDQYRDFLFRGLSGQLLES
jgi:AcrR family transcriptional regulator